MGDETQEMIWNAIAEKWSKYKTQAPQEVLEFLLLAEKRPR